ncbi:gliding motility-associated C-terminal domain-containing protein [Psychroserpens sp. S379A]|uniref:T9SS type B sorting domain-containing protein n=1 Tax=Psychroserpens sp. S379A TaxID=3415137 RepID=UPI003C7E4B25
MKKITSLLALFLVLLAWNANAQITTYPYFEDFESGDGGWTVDDPANVSWELGTPANAVINSADSGTNAWVTSLTGDYATNESGAVVSPVFDFSSLAAPSIEFSIWWNSEFSWDGMVLQSSIDAGTSWQNVGAFGDPNNWFTDDTIGGDPGGQQEGWTGRDAANGSGGWVVARHALVGLAGESNVLLRFAFGSDGSVQDEGIGFDSINVFDVSCPEPSGVTAAGVFATTADISWTAGGGETSWEIVVQPAGTGVPTGSGTPTTNNPYTATGLTAVTDYEVYVRSDCSGEFSPWVGPVTFQTACSVFVPEYNADMSVNVPDACWDESNDGEIADGPSGSGTSDWRDGTNYAFGDSNAINLFGNTDREWLLSPFFDLSAGGYQLEVNVAVTNWLNGDEDDSMGSDDEVRLLQSIDGGATWTTLTTWNAANEPAVGGTEYIEDLSGVTGTNVQFAIWASDGTVNDAEDYDFHVGKFRVRTPPTCQEPSNLTLDTFSDVTADISWTPGGSETSWEVVVQPAGTGVPTGSGVATTNNPYTATGLTATTQYEVWVLADCGAQGLSSWTGPLTFTTLNTPPPPPVGVTCTSGSSSFIFTAEFDGVDGWTGDINGGDGTWEIPNDSGSGDTGADVAFSGASYMNYEASGGATDTASAVTPAIDLTTAVDGAELSFYMHAYGAGMGTLNVGISNSPTGPFTTEFAWAGDLQTSGSDPWVPIGINLDAYLGQVIYIEFSHTGINDFEGDMSIDYVRVETCGSFCIAPSSIIVSNATQTTADIDWTANSGETDWEYVVVPLGTGEPTGSGTPVTTTSITETGLTGTTEYEVWVRANCGGGTFSLWAGPIPFFTAPENNDPCSATTAVVNADDTCTTTTFGTILQATPSGVPSGSCAGDPDDDVWFEFVALSENHVITIDNIAGGTTNIDHALYEGNCNGLTEVYCSDDTVSLTPSLIVGNTYWIRIFSGGSDNETSTFDLCISTPDLTFCLEALPICASDLEYPSIIGDDIAPPYLDYDCLGSQPDPIWNAIYFDESGDYVFTLEQTGNDGTGNDVDFIVWGPFNAQDVACADLLPENVADCSFSFVSIETIELNGVQAGDVYIILITNYSQDAGVYTFTQDSGPPDGTNCEIVCDVEILYGGVAITEDPMTPGFGEIPALCGVSSIELEASSPYADSYQWYDQDSIPIVGATSSTLTVTESGGYFVEVNGDVCEGFSYSIVVNVTLGAQAVANPVNDMITCDDASADEVEDFDLGDQTSTILGAQDPADFNVTYHASVSDAGLNMNPLPLVDYSNTSNPQTIHVRVEDANAPGCFVLSTFDLIISGPTPTVNSVTYAECDDDFDGIILFDLASQDANVLGAQDPANYNVSYHLTQDDADNNTAAIDTSNLHSSASDTIYVRIESNVAFDCYSTGTVELVVNPLPDTSFAPDTDFSYEVCPNASAPIMITAIANNYAEADVTINWYLDNGLIAGENSLTLPVIDAGTYTIEVENNLTGCIWSVDQTVIELPTCVIPQGISPNNDGLNEVFDLSSYNVSKLEIFNRNGVLVYSKKNYKNEWHGQTNDGDELPVGTYFYTMEYENGKERAAWIYIQREN